MSHVYILNGPICKCLNLSVNAMYYLLVQNSAGQWVICHKFSKVVHELSLKLNILVHILT